MSNAIATSVSSAVAEGLVGSDLQADASTQAIAIGEGYAAAFAGAAVRVQVR